MFVRAYLRASTKEQDASRAKEELFQDAHDKGLKIAATYIENESGASLNHPELFRLLSDCQAASETGLTRQTIYRIKDEPAAAEKALAIWGM